MGQATDAELWRRAVNGEPDAFGVLFERRMRSVLRTLAGLPKREQEVLALCAWAELSYEEAALALELPVGTVRSRLSRARARMRELTGETGHEVVNEA